MVDRYHFVGVALAVGLLIGLSASVGTTAGEPDPDELVEKAVDSLKNEPLEAVHTQRISGPDGEVTQTVVVHQRSSEGGYLEIVDSTGTAGQRVVFSDSTVVQQDIEDGTTVRYEELNDYLIDKYRTVGASPEEIVDHYRGTYEGTTKVDGRESHRVELASPEERTAGLSLDIDAGNLEYELPIHEATEKQWYLSRETWWIDKETFYPIKQTVEWVDQDGNVIATTTREYEELEVGPEAEINATEQVPSANETTFPEGTVSNPDLDELEMIAPTTQPDTDSESGTGYDEPDVYDTRYAANTALPFDLPQVDVPSSYTHEQSIVHEERYGVMLLYTNGQSGTTLSVQIAEGNSSLLRSSTVVNSREVSSFDGEIVVTDSGTEVVRECDDLTYRVRGPSEAETLIDVTGAIEC